jgi:hypothetical protein
VVADPIAVIDERAVFRRGVVAILDAEPTLKVVSESAQGPAPATARVAVASPTAHAGLGDFNGPVVVCWAPSDARPLRTAGQQLAVVRRDTLDAGELVDAVRRVAAGRARGPARPRVTGASARPSQPAGAAVAR